jgi:cysteine/glycine-rich protein
MPQFGGASEKCSVCSKTVYLAEKIVVEDKEDKKTFHKTCLKCSHCKATLSLGNYASMNGVMYCKPHFKQLFATKGNYDEGFGKEKHTTKWTPNAAPATPGNSFVPVDKVEDAKPAEKKDTPSSIASRFGKSTLNSEKCEKCSKTVYATEKIVIEEKDGKKVYHKACLRCSHCQVVLTLGNYSAMNGVTYCKPHLKQLFATKGNYDEGFGKEKHTTKWEPTANTTPTTFVLLFFVFNDNLLC